MSCFAVVSCFLGLVGSGFNSSIADVATSGDTVVDNPDLFAWSDVIGNVLLSSLGSIVAGATVLALSLWAAPRTPARAMPIQRQIFDAAD